MAAAGCEIEMTDAVIHIEGLTYTYAAASQPRDVSFAVGRRQSVALVAQRAGKTTLFLCLSGVARQSTDDPGRGARSDGRGAARGLPARLGIVFQNSDDQVFSPSVFDDVAFGPLNLGLAATDVRVRVTEALAQVGLSGFESRVPFHLSGGEKRRVALAGVLAMRPEILLLDEPSIFLDPRGRRELIALVQKLPVTKIIAAHDLELIRETCPRTLVLDGGRVVADGVTDTLLADAALMERHGLEVPYSLRKG